MCLHVPGVGLFDVACGRAACLLASLSIVLVSIRVLSHPFFPRAPSGSRSLPTTTIFLLTASSHAWLSGVRTCRTLYVYVLRGVRFNEK